MNIYEYVYYVYISPKMLFSHFLIFLLFFSAPNIKDINTL